MTKINGNVTNRINKYGLAVSKVNQKLLNIKNNTTHYRRDELARDLVKLAFSIDPLITVSTAQSLEVEKAKCS